MPQTNKSRNAPASESLGPVQGEEDADRVSREECQAAGDAGGGGGGGEDNVGDSEIIKSPSDPKQYRYVVLDNGLRALLISDYSGPAASGEEDSDGEDEGGEEDEEDEDDVSGDETEDESEEEEDDDDDGRGGDDDDDDDEGKKKKNAEKQSAAALCVGVGSFSDPGDLPGLAHFLEHMVFMGSEKYPSENGFDAFLKKHGGSDNASTDCERTIFQFDVQRKSFKEALDRWAQFFICPLMIRDAIDREVEAVDSEYQLAKPSDSHRKEMLFGSLAKAGHPMGKFCWGNAQTLKQEPKKKKINVYKRLRAFWKKHYSAHYMTLAVQSKGKNRMEDMETISRETLKAEMSEELGFVLEKPLTDLPDYYREWLDLANNLTHLIESHSLRDVVNKMPLLSTHLLSNHRELRLAHLVLGFISMGYVWQEGQHAPAQILPKALALPYWLVSRRLGLPPILTYADVILANWKLKDPKGNMEYSNMDMLFSFPGGRSNRGFFMVSLLVELAASSGITGALEVMHAMKNSELIGIQDGLEKVTQSLKKMKENFKLMHYHVDPTAFHGTLRIFFSGWRNNPLFPRGLLYEGASNEPISLFGASAAQSSTIQCFDALLCIQHEDETGTFLRHMRDHMPPAHRQLIETLSACPSLRDFVMSHSSSDLCHAYNLCVSALLELRNYHLNIVTKFIIIPGNRARTIGCPLRGVGAKMNAAGTSGSNITGFLKSVRNNTQKMLILEGQSGSKEIKM